MLHINLCVYVHACDYLHVWVCGGGRGCIIMCVFECICAYVFFFNLFIYLLIYPFVCLFIRNFSFWEILQNSRLKVFLFFFLNTLLPFLIYSSPCCCCCCSCSVDGQMDQYTYITIPTVTTPVFVLLRFFIIFFLLSKYERQQNPIFYAPISLLFFLSFRR